jgi:hypothetical protein
LKVASRNLKQRSNYNVESKYWNFRHEKFMRGRPDLLSEIKKSNHSESADKQEVNTLKAEVKTLKDQLSAMSSEMDRVTEMVQSGMHSQQQQQQQPDGGMSKKRRLVESSNGPQQQQQPIVEATMMAPAPIISSNEWIDHLPMQGSSNGTFDGTYDDTFHAIKQPSSNKTLEQTLSSFPAPAAKVTRQESIPFSVTSFSSTDEQMLNSMFALDGQEDDTYKLTDASHDGHKKSSMDLVKSSSDFDKPLKDSNVDPMLIQKVKVALPRLPKQIQTLFVERLVTVVTNPDAFQQQIDAITTLATSAADEATRRTNVMAGDSSHPRNEHTFALGTAVLGAFLEQCKQEQPVNPSANMF